MIRSIITRNISSMQFRPSSSIVLRDFSLTLPHLSKVRSLSVRCLLRSVALFSLLLASLPAQAADYILSDDSQTRHLPPGVTWDSAGIYSCGVLTLGADDTISISIKSGDPTPAKITFSGAFTTGDNNKINVYGDASDLTLITTAALTVGVHNVVNANVISTAAVNLGNESNLGGDLTTTGASGIVTLAAEVCVDGHIVTDAGAVTAAGVWTDVGGGITTQAGVVTLGEDVWVVGGISTVAGGVTVGASSCIEGGITTQA
ncbi:MAG: hypothetical protein ACI9UA_001403, partial [Pseudoalteromonas tetraodonis]